MNCPDAGVGPLGALRAAASALKASLMSVPGLRLETDPAEELDGLGQRFVWHNLIGAAPAFRRAHLEWLEVPGRLAVLHLCIFPQLDDTAPIFGFDVIGGQARVTGLFLDLSPVLAAAPRPSLAGLLGATALRGFAEARARPDWGDVFSDAFLAIRPHSAAELGRGIALAQQALAGMLERLGSGQHRGADRKAVLAGQTRYVEAQRCNIHTQRMLAGLIGEAHATRFVTQSLFPLPPTG
jgi:hypothetical protein